MVETVDAGGTSIALRRAGTGPPLVLLHGGLGHSAEWQPQLEGLSDRLAVIAWDAPGCGGSADAAADASLDDYADHLRAFLDALGLESVHLGGLSWGGGLAIAMATRHPARVRSLSLLSAYAGWAGSLEPDEVRLRLARALSDADRDPGDVAREWLPELLAGGAAPATAEALAGIVARARPAGARTMARAFAAADLRPRLRAVAVPTLVLAGDRDVRAPLPVARALERGIPGARLVIVPGAGHMVGTDAPRAVNHEIRCHVLGHPA